MHLQYDSTRGATLIHGITRALSRIPTYPRQLTYAHTLQNTLESLPFDCTLGGPFANLFLTRLSAFRTLCKGIINVISASSVYYIKFLVL